MERLEAQDVAKGLAPWDKDKAEEREAEISVRRTLQQLNDFYYWRNSQSLNACIRCCGFVGDAPYKKMKKEMIILRDSAFTNPFLDM